MSPLRILLSAYQCAPGIGSVSQIGWEWYSRLSQRASVTLVTHVRNRKHLDAAGAPLPGTEIIYIDTEWFASPLYRSASRFFPHSPHAVFLLSSADFYLYDAAALRALRRRRGSWDLVHAVTPVSPLASTRLYKLGIPLIVGPWNGNVQSTLAFPELLKQDSRWMYRLRGIGRLLDRYSRSTLKATLVLSATRRTDEDLPPGARVVRMLENAVDPNQFYPGDRSAIPDESQELRVIFVGRLIATKGVGMLLEAVAELQTEMKIRLTIVGDGPLREELEQEAARLGVSACTEFAGALPLSAVARRMREGHVFCLPSVRESGGGVLLEAAACGLPAITVNLGGPGELVDDEIGRALPAEGPEQLTRALVETLRDVVRNPREWRQRGSNARRRAERLHTWDAKLDCAMELYARVLKGGDDWCLNSTPPPSRSRCRVT